MNMDGARIVPNPATNIELLMELEPSPTLLQTWNS